MLTPPKRAAAPVTLPLFAAALLLVAAVTAACTQTRAFCAACGRQECANLTMTVEWSDGTQAHTCCPRCGAHLIASKPEVAAVTVRDFDTARPLAAAEAWFVDGSDVHPCRGLLEGPPRSEHGCCLLPAFDRCEPSLLAFRDSGAARRFAAQHGGTLVRWDQVTAVRRR